MTLAWSLFYEYDSKAKTGEPKFKLQSKCLHTAIRQWAFRKDNLQRWKKYLQYIFSKELVSIAYNELKYQEIKLCYVSHENLWMSMRWMKWITREIQTKTSMKWFLTSVLMIIRKKKKTRWNVQSFCRKHIGFWE